MIRGFGASDAWIGLDGATEANALFGPGNGQVGLSILRGRIDPSSTTAGSQWDGEVNAAKLAMAADTDNDLKVFASAWTPPAAWKINIPDPTNPVAEGSLDPNHYADYANYLESYVNYLATNGVNLYAISMQNEPDANVTYESCDWTPAQMDTWVAQDGSVITTRLMMPEAEGFNTAYSDPALNDPAAVKNISIIGGHLYGSSPSYYSLAVNSGMDVWMTEHYIDPAASNSLPNIGDALKMALEIHNSMTVGQYNAYVWWWVKDWNSTTWIGLVDGSDNVTYYGWAMAQFARFIRPGYVRVDATANPTAGVYVSAYMGNGHSAIVAINQSSSDQSVAFTIKNKTISSLTPYETTATQTVAAQAPVSVTSSQFTYALPAQSIVTFAQ